MPDIQKQFDTDCVGRHTDKGDRGMYTKRELKRAAGIIRQIARDNHVTEEEVRRDMKEAMDAGRRNPDPAVQAKWAGFEYSGDEPTLEEFILWMAGQVR